MKDKTLTAIVIAGLTIFSFGYYHSSLYRDESYKLNHPNRVIVSEAITYCSRQYEKPIQGKKIPDYVIRSLVEGGKLVACYNYLEKHKK